MPTTLTGSASDPTTSPTASGPADTDPGNAASVNTPLQSILNFIAWLRTKIGPIDAANTWTGTNTFNAAVNLSGGLGADLNANSHKITSLPTPSSASEPATKGYADALITRWGTWFADEQKSYALTSGVQVSFMNSAVWGWTSPSIIRGMNGASGDPFGVSGSYLQAVASGYFRLTFTCGIKATAGANLTLAFSAGTYNPPRVMGTSGTAGSMIVTLEDVLQITSLPKSLAVVCTTDADSTVTLERPRLTVQALF